jgi:hypothetical protein
MKKRKVYAVETTFQRRIPVNKQRMGTAAFLFLFGAVVLFNILNDPRLKGLHGVDLVRLMAAGFCFGVGFGILVGARKFSGK